MQLLVQASMRTRSCLGTTSIRRRFTVCTRGRGARIRTFNLGRGRQRDKLRLGANRFHVLSNYLLRFEAKPDGILDAVNAAAFRKMERDLRELSDEGGSSLRPFDEREIVIRERIGDRARAGKLTPSMARIGRISLAVPVRNASSASHTSLGYRRVSAASIFLRRASSRTAWRVMPSRAQSAMGVSSAPF